MNKAAESPEGQVPCGVSFIAETLLDPVRER
jgi:hypothetical protein